MRYLLIYSLIFICLSCKEETPWRIDELCAQVDHLHLGRIDSLLILTEKLTPLEKYGFHCYIQRICNSSRDTKQTELKEHYRQKFREQPFPITNNKESGFLLMQQFAYGRILPEDVDLKMLSKLLFDMGNRFNFTPEERVRYLTLKSSIYLDLFRDEAAGLSVANEAANFARKNGLKGKNLFDIYKMQNRCCKPYHDWNRAIELANELLDSTKNYQLDSTIRQEIYTHLYLNYRRQKNDNKTYYYWKKIGKKYAHFTDVVDILLGCDRVSEAIDYLEEQKQKPVAFEENSKPSYIHLGNIAWAQANICRHQGDSGGYEHYLKKAVHYFDLVPGTDIQLGALSEAYARLLWAAGKHQEAISRMESLSRRLLKLEYYSLDLNNTFSKRSERLELLADYYMRVGRSANAYHQMKLVDSVRRIETEALLKREQFKKSSSNYTEELRSSLEIRTMNFLKEQQKVLFITLLLGCAVILSIVFGWLYWRRQKELNVIYDIQKKSEQIESALIEMETIKNPDDLPADEQLYLHLQKQMYEQKLFLKPDFSRNDLCRLAGSNRMYVSTSINKYAGMNINNWINKARVNYAISLVHSGETRLQTLSDSSGFSSPSAFFRNFKQFTLLTPTQYIEREKKATSSKKNKITESLLS